MLDFGVIGAAWLLGYLAGFAGTAPFGARGVIPYLLIPIATQLFFNQVIGLYGPVWRYASVEEAVRVVAAVSAGIFVSTFELAWYADVRHMTLPLLSAPPVAALLILLGCGGIRFQARLFALERQRDGRSTRLRTLIVGATDQGVALALELERRTFADSVVVGFVDDDVQLVGRSVRAMRILGTTTDIERVCKAERIDRILIALPDASRERLGEIEARALKTDAQVKVLAGSSDTDGAPLLNSLRDLDLTDLLGREHAPVDPGDIADYLEGANVLVTGAGGSIGSEIARQVSRFGPARLLLLDRDDSLLFEAVSSLDKAEPILADIRDESRLRDIFGRYEPDVIFHAAAHKHVPILESHPAEAVQTNLLGTWTLAQVAADHGCTFVHISTDKAADPACIMGASKRAAELAVLSVGEEHGLPFAAVRFGNVLGSRGSVVPTFFRQIVEGGPVTVTDPEMTRYFMTIPEAVSLVLQAGSMADKRKVFVLEMGKPVRIIELARQMIRLAGHRPDEDIQIEIVGTRPGERLHEYLHDGAEIVEPTRHPSIRGLTPKVPTDPTRLLYFIEVLRRSCAGAPDQVVVGLLDQMLAENGVQCHLDAELRAPAVRTNARRALRAGIERSTTESADVDLTRGDRDNDAASANGDRRTDLPALLGGNARFAPGVPFARPARPPLERVVRRLQPSYDRGMLTNGPLVGDLERRIAERLGVSHVVALSSCTSGLMLVLQALTDTGSGPVVLPSFTFSASAHAVAWNGLTPRFVECLPDSFQIDTAHAAAALEGASAILATHVFGAPCDPRRVEDIAREYGIPVVFDAAHALGALADQIPVGSFGTAEVFSLTPTKPLVAGEGGLVATNDSALAETLRIGRDYGNPGDYDTRFVGLNARMSEFHAAMALESLELLDESLERRRYLASLYRAYLDDVPGIELQAFSSRDTSTFKDLTIKVDADTFGIDRDGLALALLAEGVDTRKYFDPPVHRQRAYAHLEHARLPVTDAVSRSVLSLPVFPDLDDEQVEKIAEIVRLIHSHAVELDAYISTMTEVDARMFELD
ncbi:MAG TPA: aminotransferase class I/II-fold pyridoxal phosphate-dependent enzyme [Acidimicrobiia bacterium]|nr:aminotransferase class I/II-fold pyridoxal phosphate-dependent enzyme [Acidimicrobiia bacterium]